MGVLGEGFSAAGIERGRGLWWRAFGGGLLVADFRRRAFVGGLSPVNFVSVFWGAAGFWAAGFGSWISVKFFFRRAFGRGLLVVDSRRRAFGGEFRRWALGGGISRWVFGGRL